MNKINKKGKDHHSYKHGYARGKNTHLLYVVWSGIKRRCSNKNHKDYKFYGGRGIVMCKEWLNNPKAFIEWCFLRGWEKGLEVDRKENSGNYSPENCRLVTREINQINARMARDNISGYIGISFRKLGRKYMSSLTYKKRFHYIGLFVTKKEAIEARNRIIRLFDLPHKIQTFKEDQK